MPLKRHERQAIGFLLRHLVVGIIGAGVFWGLILSLDIGHLRTLAGESGDGVLSILLLLFGLIVTFGGVAMAVGVMSLARDEN